MAHSLNPDRVYQQMVKRHPVEPIANGLKPRSTHTGAYRKADSACRWKCPARWFGKRKGKRGGGVGHGTSHGF